jgi:hypothetical protein
VRSLVAAAALLIALVVAAPASAASRMDVGMADDGVLMHGSDLEALAAVFEWRELGIDVVRIHARWVGHVPEPLSPVRPLGFDPRDPEDLGYNWSRLDRAVSLVRSAGMRVILTVTGSGPLWGVRDPSQGSPRVDPDPAQFADYAHAVARRFGGQVDEYIIWNEPNLPLWLQPQSTCTAPRRCTPHAPHLYRRLVQAAEPVIRAADPGARVMIGALAPRGESGRSRNSELRPLAFLRAMGCVDARHRRVRTGPCRGFRPAQAYGLAYHPHSTRSGPTAPARHADDAQMGDLGKLVRAVDAITRANGLRSRAPGGRFPLYLTEWGYETRPPDTVRGVSAARQSLWLQQGAYLAWRNPRVRNLTQYAWRDEPYRVNAAGWQSGLRYVNGRRKPAFATFKVPFWAERVDRRTVRAWGQVRPGVGATVLIERSAAGGAWIPVTDVRTDARGYFRRNLRFTGPVRLRFRHGLAGTSSVRRVR